MVPSTLSHRDPIDLVARLGFLLAILIMMVIAACDGDGVTPGGYNQYATLALDVAYPEPFSYLSGVRELSDGTILAADPTSQVLLRINLDEGSADTLGRQGPGPQEYEGPDRVFPLPGDSSLLVDLGNSRLTVIDPEGRFVESTPMTTATADGIGRSVHPKDVDGAGNLYAGGPPSPQGPADTTEVHKIERETREETRVAAAWRAPYVRPGPGDKRPMLTLFDEWAVGSDGRVAVVRANRYSVDWFLPDGRVVNGPSYEVEGYPVGVAEQEAALEHFATNAVMSLVNMTEDGVQERRMSRGAPQGYASAVDDFSWPATLPAFHPDGALIAPNGRAWVHRMMPAGGPGRVDVFDGAGVREGYIELPARSRVVGFGETGNRAFTVYLARTDDVGLVWLERHLLERI